MKVIAPLSGAVAIRIAIEDVIPSARVSLPDLLAALQEKYSFSTMSEIAPNQPIVMQNGKVVLETDVLPFVQLLMMQGGDIVYSSDTDAAGRILDDLISFMVERFKYRFNDIHFKRYMQSAVVVEFDDDKCNLLSALSLFESELEREGVSMNLKRLGFGRIDHDPGIAVAAGLSPLDALQYGDFLIERRVGSKAASNRFFSTAPLSTSNHIKLLQRLEDVTGDKFFEDRKDKKQA